MGSFSDYLEIKVLEHIVGKTTYASPSAYIALYTTTPADSGGGVEVSDPSYVRQYTPGSSWTAATSGQISNAVQITFNAATTSWGTVNGFSLSDSLSGGNILVWGDVTVPKAVGAGDIPIYNVGQLIINLD